MNPWSWELWLVNEHVVGLLTSQHADLASAKWSNVIDHEGEAV
jgi:hypothetical protein